MASVFLSYVREDAEKARTIATLLDRAGHSVWWDRQIKGGAEYSDEIEAALTTADKVVVLWSAQSVRSAWVRDEAAAGRDTGRLVPVQLDATSPPLGFRQFQSIDLTKWNGHSRSPPFQNLLAAIGTGATASPTPDSHPPPAEAPGSFRLPRWALLTAALIILAAIGGWWWMGRGQSDAPVVAIDTGTATPQSRQVARQLAVRLGELQSARNDSFHLISGPGKADIVLQVDADDSANALRRDLSVLSGTDRSILWSTSLQQPLAKKDELEQQLTLTSESVLSCAIEALSQRRDRIDASTLKLYLAGCSRLEEAYGASDYDPGLIAIFEQVVRRAPHFEGAWNRLFSLEAEVVRTPDPPSKLVSALREQIGKVEKLGLAPGALYAAKAALLPQTEFGRILAVYEAGIRADPDEPLLYRLRGEEFQRVGRMDDAVFDAAQALKLDPLSPALQDSYMSALAYAGKIDSAYEQLRKSEAMWPNASNIQMARYRLDLRYGDPRQALAMFHASTTAMDPAQEDFLVARIDPTPQNIEKAINRERALYAREPRYIAGLTQALAEFGRNDEVIDVLLNYQRLDALGFNAEVLFRTALRGVWRDPKSMAAASRLGFIRYWRSTGNWPDFCSDPTLPYDCKEVAAKYP